MRGWLDPSQPLISNSTFVSGWTLEAVEAMCYDSRQEATSASDEVASLLEKSLLRKHWKHQKHWSQISISLPLLFPSFNPQKEYPNEHSVEYAGVAKPYHIEVELV